MKRIHRGIVVLLAGAALTSGCLPLPPEVQASLCYPNTSRPTTDDLAVIERLNGRGLLVSLTSPPSVRLAANRGDAATALRAEFGSTIDIQLGTKRLKRVEGNPDACITIVPTWAIGSPVPKGVAITTTPTSPSFDRHGGVTARVRVTNRTGRSIVASQLTSTSCPGAPGGDALTSTTSPLTVNVADGVRPQDPHFFLWSVGGNAHGDLRRADDGTFSISTPAIGCITSVPSSQTIRAGRSATIEIAASTESVQRTDDPYVSPGRYHLRAMVDLRLSTAAGAPTQRVAAPPVEVTLTG